MTSKTLSKYGTPKLDRANFDKALHEWLYDYFGEEIYYETETFDEVINYNLGIPTSLLESEYRDTDEIRVGGEYIERDEELVKEWIQEKSDNNEEEPVVTSLSRRVDRLEKMMEDTMEAIVQLNEKVISIYEK